MQSITPIAQATRRSHRILAPLATLAAAGALVVGSGADFSSSSENPTSMVASGSFAQVNSRDGQAIFNVSNIKPGDTVTGSVVITNTGSLPARFEVVENADNGFENPALLQMTITEDGTTLYSGPFGDLADTTDLGRFEANESREYTYVVELSHLAENAEQGKEASASYTWNAVQTDDVDIDQRADEPVVEENANP